MAEQNEPTTMTPEEASALERKIQLEGWRDPNFVHPDGRTTKEIREAQAKQDEADQKAAKEFDGLSREANTPQVERVALVTTPNGAVHTATVSVTPAPTQQENTDTLPAQMQGGEQPAPVDSTVSAPANQKPARVVQSDKPAE